MAQFICVQLHLKLNPRAVTEEDLSGVSHRTLHRFFNSDVTFEARSLCSSAVYWWQIIIQHSGIYLAQLEQRKYKYVFHLMMELGPQVELPLALADYIKTLSCMYNFELLKPVKDAWITATRAKQTGNIYKFSLYQAQQYMMLRSLAKTLWVGTNTSRFSSAAMHSPKTCTNLQLRKALSHRVKVANCRKMVSKI